MKIQSKSQFFPAVSLFLGLAGWAVRSAMYRYAMDAKGLLVSAHPLVWALCALAAAAAVLCLISVRGEEKPLTGPAVFPALGAFVLAAGLVKAGLDAEIVRAADRIYPILGVLGSAGLVWAGISHLRGREPFFACTAIPSLFLTLFTISCYNTWSGNPHTHEYILSGGGLILLAVAASCQAGFAVDLGWGKLHRAAALGAGFCCFAAIPLAGNPLLLFTGGLWALLSLYRPVREV